MAELLVQHSTPLEKYYLNTCYPSYWTGYADTPSEHYMQEDADQAKKHAEAVLTINDSIMKRAMQPDFEDKSFIAR